MFVDDDKYLEDLNVRDFFGWEIYSLDLCLNVCFVEIWGKFFI